jgi:hypothetical protein
VRRPTTKTKYLRQRQLGVGRIDGLATPGRDTSDRSIHGVADHRVVAIDGWLAAWLIQPSSIVSIDRFLSLSAA